VAFQILKKFKPDLIKSRNLDTSILSMYYKGVQQLLIGKTSVEQTTDYFFCENYEADKHLFVVGNPTAAQKKLFRAACKGEEGFDKKKVSIGSCFILEENNKKILCLYPDTTLSKGKKGAILKNLRIIQRASWKEIYKINWLTAPLIVDAQDSTKVESAVDNKEPIKKVEPLVTKEDLIAKAKDLKRGIKKLVKDVMPRYKKRETTDKDAAFVNALRKAGHLFLAQLPQTDEKTQNRFSSQKKTLESGLPQWKELETRIHSLKGKAESTVELKKSLLATVEKMKATRTEIKEILKRVDLKTLG
jgi:hypothetical protein